MQRRKNLLVASLLLGLNSITVEAALESRAGGTMVYDTDLNVTWVADANLFATQAASNPNLVAHIIANVGVVTGHNLVPSDFNADTNSTRIGEMHWWGAQAWVSTLTYGGFSDWRLAATLQPDSSCNNQSGSLALCTGSELGHLFYNELGGTAGQGIVQTHNSNYNLFINIQNHGFWSASEETINPANAWMFRTNAGIQAVNGKNGPFYAWAVRDGDVAAVPLPSAILLFGTGILGLLSARRCGNIG